MNPPKTKQCENTPSQTFKRLPILSTDTQITNMKLVNCTTAELDNCNVTLAQVCVDVFTRSLGTMLALEGFDYYLTAVVDHCLI
jgi:hypothetical protein